MCIYIYPLPFEPPSHPYISTQSTELSSLCNTADSCWLSSSHMVMYMYCQQIWKTQQWPQDWKRLVFIPIPKKGNAKECSNYRTIAFISHASKVMLKILQARLQQYVNFQMLKLDLEKAEEPEIKLPTSVGSMKKQEFQKNIYLCFIDYAEAFDCVDHHKLKNSERDGNSRPPYLPPEKSICRSGSNS